ncbi:hypothetical protein FAP39_16990 [Shimia litoralis]|uniref:Uncharacterized protein n=1 Tax=Shimia litoralis TaxID=420403 RepID=A0A4U7MTE5_9RHOB|nr:hypothetical protein [Shimia litoralis]TKZ15484.1 hypothetical protein FAP39_16990 [Shimia litoralis]
MAETVFRAPFDAKRPDFVVFMHTIVTVDGGVERLHIRTCMRNRHCCVEERAGVEAWKMVL